MADEDWSALAEDLRCVRVELQAVRRAIAKGGRALRQVLTQTHQHELYQLTEKLLRRPPTWAGGVPPRLREAVLAAVEEVLASNACTSEALRASDPAADPTAADALCFNGSMVERYAQGLMELFGRAERSSGAAADLVPAVASAGVAMLDCGALAACRSPPGSATLPSPSLRLKAHTYPLLALLRFLSDMRAQRPEVYSELRASTFCPEAILRCMRRLVWRELASPDGAAGGDRGGVCPENDGAPVVWSLLLSGDEAFAPERAAIAADAALTEAICAQMAAALRRWVDSGGEDVPIEFGASHIRASSLSGEAGAAATVLSLAPLLRAVRGRARADPAFLPLIIDATSLFLRADPVVHTGPRGILIHESSLASCLKLLYFVCAGKAAAGAEPFQASAPASVACLPLAAAVAAELLQGNSDHLPDAVLIYVRGLFAWFTAPWARLEGGRGASAQQVLSVLGAQMLDALRAVEGLARLVVLLRQAGPEWSQLVEVAGKVQVNFVAVLEEAVSRAPEAVLLSEDGLQAAATTLDLATKLTFLPRPVLPISRDVAIYSSQTTLFATVLLEEIIVHLERRGSGLPPEWVRRWQGAALAHAAAVVAGTRHGDLEYKQLFGARCSMNALVVMFFVAPDGDAILERTDVGREALRLAFESFVDAEHYLPASFDSRAIRRMLDLLEAGGLGRAGVVKAMARLGLLSELARCAERNCQEYWPGETPPDGDPRGGAYNFFVYVGMVVNGAVNGSNMPDVKAAALALGGPSGWGEPAHWRRLRVEVLDPLAAALREEAAAAEGDPAAAALELAVEAAEALATRRCAHPACTTVVGTSEAAAPKGKRCSACRLVRYCGAACQKADWSVHKAACREIVRRREGGGSEA